MSRSFLTSTLFLVCILSYTETVVAIQSSAGQPRAVAGQPRAVIVQPEQPADIAKLIEAYNNLQGEVFDPDSKEYREYIKKDEDLRTALKAYILKKIEDEDIRREETRQVVNQTNASASVTFWIAHILLVLSILISGFELWHAKRLRSKAKKESIEVEISLEKIALKSSVNGTLMLFISLVFYFMYLKFVYPIISIG